jgi:signal transduction histidine kinase
MTGNGQDPPSTRLTWLETGRLAELGLQAATLVHELRQPLFAVSALVDLLAADAGPRPDPRLALLRAELRHMDAILARYAILSRRADGRRDPFDPRELFEETLHAISFKAERLAVRLELQVEEGLPAMVGDVVALRQVLLNLLQNALDAVDHQGGGLVVLRAARQGGGIVVEVSDNGPGIPPECLERVFDPFFTTKPPEQGTGLGLPIARETVRRLGGDLSLSSDPRGTVARLLLDNGKESQT